MPNYQTEDEAVTDLKTSKFNSAGLLNLTLHDLWKEARTHARQGNYDRWNQDLDMIWGELGGDLKETDVEVKKYSDISKKIYMTGSLLLKEIRGFNTDVKPLQVRAKQYLLLLEKHLWLKRLQNNLGKGTAYRDELEDDFD